MLLGLFLALLGILFLLRNLGIIAFPADFWSILWPIIVLVLGVYFVMGALKARHYKHMFLKRFFGKDEE